MTQVIRAKLRAVDGLKDPNDFERAGRLKDAINEAVERAQHEQQPNNDHDLLDWAGEFALTESEANAIDSPEWAYENLIIEGHFVVICARSGHGKTTVMLRVSADMAASGYRVIYVNADTAGGDAKSMVEQAKLGGFQMLLPDLKLGKSMKDVVDRVRKMADSPGDLSGVVLVFDTLKKMADVINKSAARELYSLLRKLTARGVTCIALAHTNKYAASDGSPIFEGTGDLRSDCDDLIYLIGDKQENGRMLISTLPDKERGSFQPITFEIDAERNVSRRDEYVDVLDKQAREKRLEDDMDAIEIIASLLMTGPQSQARIVEHCREHGMNRKRTRRVLAEYGHAASYRQHWVTERSFKDNALRYRLPDELAKRPQ